MKESGKKQGAASPCAACKLLRRRCAQDCVFAPYFPADEPQKFANVHKVFGASNVNKMLQDSDFPCFKGGPRTIQNLRKRFHLSLTEEQCVSLVLSLISSSLDAWRTRQYDYYQRVLNGIL